MKRKNADHNALSRCGGCFCLDYRFLFSVVLALFSLCTQGWKRGICLLAPAQSLYNSLKIRNAVHDNIEDTVHHKLRGPQVCVLFVLDEIIHLL